jgi:threonine aldolase
MAQFGSDNHAPTHPEILQSIHDENQGMSASYGIDQKSQELQKWLNEELKTSVQVFSVFTGTAANVLSFSHLKSFESIAVCATSHIWLDECGAPEKFLGCKLWPLPSRNGLLSLTDLQQQWVRRGDQHYSQLKAVSLTLPSEIGTVYKKEKLLEITNFCKLKSLFLHIDGTRLFNALHTYKWTLREFVKQVQPDAISLGGSKNGFVFGELILSFSEELNQSLKYTRKQMGQLPSKSRYVAAQFLKYLTTGLAEKIASEGIGAAEKLARELKSVDPKCVGVEQESNAVFANFHPKVISALKKKGHVFYVWEEKSHLCRLMTHWGTTDEEISSFVRDFKEASLQFVE